MANPTNLKPCPCCGGKAECSEQVLGWRVCCTKCGTRSRMEAYEDRAIALWNRRTP